MYAAYRWLLRTHYTYISRDFVLCRHQFGKTPKRLSDRQKLSHFGRFADIVSGWKKKFTPSNPENFRKCPKHLWPFRYICQRNISYNNIPVTVSRLCNDARVQGGTRDLSKSRDTFCFKKWTNGFLTFTISRLGLYIGCTMHKDHSFLFRVRSSSRKREN